MSEDQNLLIGALATVACVVSYGTAFVPIKKFEARDGIFVSLMMSVGLLIPGLVASLAYGTPTVFPLALLSGAFYAIANSCSMFILDKAGMAVGYLTWNVVTALTGWAIARFGLFGIPAETPASEILNGIGVAVLILGGFVFTFVRSNPIPTRAAPHYKREPFETKNSLSNKAKQEAAPTRLKICAFGLAIMCGLLYGNIPTPINYLVGQQRQGSAGVSPHHGAYMLSFAVGSILTSQLIFTGYSLSRHNRPFINVEIAVPSLVGGILYGIANALLFVATEHLDQAIAFPICSMAPSIFNTLWAVLFYKEIEGSFNMATLALAYLITLSGIVCIAVSKLTFI